MSRRTLFLIAAIGFVIAGLAVLTSPSTHTYLRADGSDYVVLECGSPAESRYPTAALGAVADILTRRSRQHRQKVILPGGLEVPADQPLAAEWEVAGGVAALVPQGEEPGFGVWNTDTGELLFWTVEWAETEFTASGLLALSNDRLVLMAWPEMTEIASLPAPAGADSLVVSASQKVVVIGQRDGPELAGYQVFHPTTA